MFINKIIWLYLKYKFLYENIFVAFGYALPCHWFWVSLRIRGNTSFNFRLLELSEKTWSAKSDLFSNLTGEMRKSIKDKTSKKEGTDWFTSKLTQKGPENSRRSVLVEVLLFLMSLIQPSYFLRLRTCSRDYLYSKAIGKFSSLCRVSSEVISIFL